MTKHSIVNSNSLFWKLTFEKKMLTTFIYHTSFKSDLQIDVKHLHNNAEEKVGHNCNRQI